MSSVAALVQGSGSDPYGTAIEAGEEALASERSLDAIAHFEKALRLRPDEARPHLGLGMAWFIRVDYERAVHHLDAVVERAPNAWQPHHYLGRIDLQRRRPDAALAHFRDAARLDPKSAEHRHLVGRALRALGREGEAERAYAAALALDPWHLGARLGRGSALRALGRKKEARVELAEHARRSALVDRIEFGRRGVRLNPAHAPNWVLLARAYIAAERWVEARMALEEATRLDADTPGLDETRARLPR
jgi:tetratricopeptide (TPR) repeat protein